MKKLLLLLSLISSFAYGQKEHFQGEFYVVTIHADTVLVNYQTVIVAYDQETREVCVDTDILRCFTDLKPMLTYDAFLGTMKSLIGDTYLMRIVYDDYGMTIWLTNVDHQYPHLVITTREPK